MGKGSKSTTNTVAKPPDFALPALKSGISGLQTSLARGDFGVTPYSGPRVADLSSLERKGLSMIDAGAGTARGLVRSSSNALGGMIANGVRDTEAIEADVLGSVIPQVNDIFANSGMADSSLHADTAARAATQAIAPIRYNALGEAQDRTLRGISLAPAVAGAQTDPGVALATAGSRITGQQQAQLDALRQLQGERDGADFEEQARIADLVTRYAGLGGSTVSSGGNSPGLLETAGGLGSLGTSAILAYSLLCDRRLKRDIQRIGTWRGVALYAFRYLWDDVLRVGPMAQELPWAAVELPGGVLAVDMRRV